MEPSGVKIWQVLGDGFVVGQDGHEYKLDDDKPIARTKDKWGKVWQVFSTTRLPFVDYWEDLYNSYGL